jgi:uncharacterized protein
VKQFKWRWFLRAVLVVGTVIPALWLLAFSPLVALPIYNRVILFPVGYSAATYNEDTVCGATARDHYFHSSNGKTIHGWLFLRPKARFVTLVNHGNGGNITNRKDVVKLLMEAGSSVFLYDYEGYGRSEGQASLTNLVQDAHNAYDYLIEHEHYKPDQIVIFGESLGTLVAAQLSSQVQCAGIILQCPLYSLTRRAKEIVPFLQIYPDWIWPNDGFNTGLILSRKHAPLLVVAGTKDRMTPVPHADALVSDAITPKTYVRIEGAGHTGDPALMNAPSYKEAVFAFFSALPGSENDLPSTKSVAKSK